MEIANPFLQLSMAQEGEVQEELSCWMLTIMTHRVYHWRQRAVTEVVSQMVVWSNAMVREVVEVVVWFGQASVHFPLMSQQT